MINGQIIVYYDNTRDKFASEQGRTVYREVYNKIYKEDKTLDNQDYVEYLLEKKIVVSNTVITKSLLSVKVESTKQNDEYKVDIRGAVTSINTTTNGATILVEGPIQKDTTYDKATVYITPDTTITKIPYSRLFKSNEIRVGNIVEVTFTGPVRESYPVQADAKWISIISEK